MRTTIFTPASSDPYFHTTTVIPASISLNTSGARRVPIHTTCRLSTGSVPHVVTDLDMLLTCLSAAILAYCWTTLMLQASEHTSAISRLAPRVGVLAGWTSQQQTRRSPITWPVSTARTDANVAATASVLQPAPARGATGRVAPLMMPTSAHVAGQRSTLATSPYFPHTSWACCAAEMH